MLHGVDPIFADLHAELSHLSLPIGDEGDQAFAEHGVIPFAQEGVVVPMFQRARDACMRLQLDVKSASLPRSGLLLPK